jgi:hypothetical protein
MIEFLVVAGIASGVAGAVAGGISLGSRYVEAKLHYEDQNVKLDQPILAPRARRGSGLGEDHAA